MSIKMKRGDTWADIYDSPETIAQATQDGYHIASADELMASGLTAEPSTQSELDAEATEETVEVEKKLRGRPPKQESVNITSSD
jgi:hypothetical protein